MLGKNRSNIVALFGKPFKFHVWNKNFIQKSWQKTRKSIQISYMWISLEVRKNKGKDGHSEEEYIISVIYIYSLLYRILFQDMQVTKNLSSCRQARRRKLSYVKMLLLNDENYFS